MRQVSQISVHWHLEGRNQLLLVLNGHSFTEQEKDSKPK